MVVRMEAERWLEEETGFAGEKIIQAFTFNMDGRITDLEHRAHKADAVLDKLCEKNNMRVRKVQVPAHCQKCGSPMLSDAQFCRKCGQNKKAVRQLTVPK